MVGNRIFRMTCIAGLAAFAASALADLSDVILTIHAVNGRSEGTLEITADQGTWQGDDFFWSTDEAIPITSGTEVLGTFGPGAIAFGADPSIALGFSIQAASTETTFSISSSALGFETIDPAVARTSGAFTLQDFTGGGASLNGTLPEAYAFRALLNDGTVFHQAVQSITVVPPEQLAIESFVYPAGGGYEPVDPAYSMAIEIGFTLSPNAFASGSANFEVIPEPTGLLLLVVGAGLLRRR
jgi:hypothetical protein